MSRGRILALVAGAASAAVLVMASLATLSIASSGLEILRAPFRLMCHGQLDRAFEIAETAMPICARCTGIYGGILLGAITLSFAPIVRRRRLLFLVGMAIALPMVIDGLMQLFGFWATGEVARSVTGLLFGIGLIVLAVNGVAGAGGRESAGKKLDPAFP